MQISIQRNALFFQKKRCPELYDNLVWIGRGYKINPM